MDRINSDLYVEVPVNSRPKAAEDVSSASKSAKAQKARGFDPGKALGGIGAASSTRSACHTRGDGKYQNGTSFLQEGNKVHIGPAAFSAENIEETMRELDKFGVFGARQGTAEGRAEGSLATAKAEKPGGHSGPATSSLAPLDTQMVQDLEKFLSLSEKVQKSRTLDESLSGLYDISGEAGHSKADGGAGSLTLGRSEPDHSIKWIPEEASPRKLEVRVKLPEVDSVKDVTLTLEDSKKLGRTLSVSSWKHELKIPVDRFPAGAVEALKPRAKWNKEKKTLKVVLS
ncbi:hypothetical protein HOP50_06g45240 [Chloropicon primus]|nr:hypothetical protein HOP50_06g45240 [Chloropicon primus]